MERYLVGIDFLACKDVSLGTGPLRVWAYYWFQLPLVRPKLRFVEDWYQRLCGRAAYRKHIIFPLS